MTGGPLGRPRTGRGGEPPALDTGVAHVARAYDYWLGGNARASSLTPCPAQPGNHDRATPLDLKRA
jgi:hypothetical protein